MSAGLVAYALGALAVAAPAVAGASSGETDAVVSWAVTGVIGGAAAIAVMMASWLLQSHLALIREFDAFKGEVRSQYVSTPALEKAFASMLAPLAKELEACVRAQDRQGRLLTRMAAKMHVPTVDDED